MNKSLKEKGKRHPVDIYVGNRLRKKRLEAGMSQEHLGNSINVTFQQIQKYEKGYNRISCSKLFEISQQLDTKIGYFFEGLPYTKDPSSEGLHPLYSFPSEAANSLNDVAYYNPYDDSWHTDPDIRQLVESFAEINDRQVRAAIISIVRSFTRKGAA